VLLLADIAESVELMLTLVVWIMLQKSSVVIGVAAEVVGVYLTLKT
jgi:hypothetical protein